MNCSIKLSLVLCLLIALIAILPEKSTAEIDPSAAADDDDSSDSSASSPYSSSSSNELDENDEDSEQRYNSDWQRLIKSMCMNLIASNNNWFATANSSLRRKCLAYLISGRSSSSSYTNNRQRRFFQIHVGKTNQLKSESDAKAGFKYGRK